MLTELFEYLRNWFYKARYDGQFTIENGELQTQYIADGVVKSCPLLDGQCFRISNSILNDGVYRYPASDLKDETFDGVVWSMAVPPAVLQLADDIQKWQDTYGSAEGEALSPFASESLDGVYSYTKGSQSSAGSVVGNGNSWQDAFGARLALWRKI